MYHWWKIGIQNKVEEMAHYREMQMGRINAWNTSSFVFDELVK
ncbi:MULTISPECIES: hypothetical protein [Heyndrickxia]|nr:MULTISPECIES: hypothetical protein [Heyndrickxia]MEC2224949.1 hypothetical protein [Weizmannia sp. CD-2023]